MKWIKKLLKYMLILIAGIISVIVILMGITIVNTNWHTKKFRFENFKTPEELIAYIKTNFPSGSDTKPLIDLFQNAGAKCRIIPEEYYSKKDKELVTHFLYNCTYNAGWLYHPQLTEYGVTIREDANQKLIDFAVSRGYGGL